MSTEFWIQILIEAVGIGIFGGTILTKINYLEKKQDKHNCLIERMVVVEQNIKENRHDIDRHEHNFGKE